MGYGKPDVYCDADNFGLTQVDEVELEEGCYSFDTVVVWKDAAGKHYWAHDSGCSCPSPFEGYTSIDTLKPLMNDHDLDELTKVVMEPDYKGSIYDLEGKTKFMQTVRDSMRGRP